MVVTGVVVVGADIADIAAGEAIVAVADMAAVGAGAGMAEGGGERAAA